ncbi:MAG: CopG family transcriptional regulator [Symploca sp. SIO2C1]|nr:CopG family transcriptional regulator [Symploca sp. SIO2C1]
MKDKKLEVRMTAYEMLQLEQEATRRGMTKSELMRSLIAKFPEPKDFKALKSATLPSSAI